MAVIEKYLLGTPADVLTTELNGLANNALAITSTPYDNTIGGGGGDGYTLADVELVATYGVAPAAATGVSVWFLGTQNGTDYEDGGITVTPARPPDVVVPVRAVTTAQRIGKRCWLPWGNFHVCVKNDSTGQAMAASGNVLSIRPVTSEGV